VLFLEDDEDTAHIFESYLRNSEFQPILASRVSQAEVWTARHKPAAVVADIYIGEEQSWGFIIRLREKLPELPLIVTSAHDERQNALSRGANLFLEKPLERENLLRELRRLTVQTGTRRLLLVDDNEVSRYILRDLLSQPWLDIREAANGTDALSALGEGLPDAVILDLLMPDMSGFDILRKLRADPATQSLPVLIYTSKVLSDVEKAQLDSLDTRVIRKEDITTRLSAQPFLDWVKSVGIAPEIVAREKDG
jgi:CheY-like chemotaxis protein